MTVPNKLMMNSTIDVGELGLINYQSTNASNFNPSKSKMISNFKKMFKSTKIKNKLNATIDH